MTLAGGEQARLDIDDGEVGKAAVAQHPVGEEPAEIFAAGLVEELLEGDGLDGGVVRGESLRVLAGLLAPVAESLLEG